MNARAGAWRSVLVVGMLATAVHSTVHGALQPYLYDTIAVFAPVAILLGIRLHRPARPRPWVLLAAGTGLWVVGDLLFAAAHDAFPSVADIAYLASYPALVLGIAIMARDRLPGRDRPGMIDAGSVTVAAFLPAWMFLMSPVVGDAGSSVLARSVSIAYPLADLFVVAVLVRLLVTPGRRPAAYWLLLGGVALNLAADAVFAVPAVSATYSASSPLESLYLLGYVLLAAAALHPSMANVSTAASAGPTLPPARWRVAIVGVAGMTAPLLLGIESFQHDLEYVPLLLAGWCLLLVLVVARLSLLVRDLAVLAELDPLTRLPNRVLLLDKVDKLLQRRGPDAEDIALLYVDLDRFKLVNDSIGHAGGDLLLIEVADRLRATVRPGDLVSRLGGDEFVVLCEDVADEAAVRLIAERLVAAISEPFWIHGAPQFLSASVGISRVTALTTDASGLLKDADSAMYRAKTRGKARAEVFDPSLPPQVSLRARFERDLHDAIDADDLMLHYQVVVDLRTGLVSGVEALVRWEHPSWGLSGPESMLPVAKETGLIVPMGRWVVAAACEQMAAWQDAGLGGAPELVVNVAHRELLDTGYLDRVVRCLTEWAIAPARLVLDIADDELADVASVVRDTLHEARQMGIHVCIDGFGAGRHSLGNLRRVPIDRVKLDRSFAGTIAGDAGHRTILAAVLELGASLGVDVVAAGIETDEQRRVLRDLGCDFGQGNLWAPPRPADAVFATPLPTLS